ncbi:hypothetical protein [Acidibrevibacterium fodinaquatile]|uniref:hypothetical protein n=1 Tax=Acidibrevibacterium fodinaquatile TaxID=1969806 RepID=UPI0013B46048|nr:hypothetical protein [Acidibrevibacterium fodinaquatile]
MSDYTIENFWKPRLSVQRMPSADLIGGWSFPERGLTTFKEAPLNLNSELDDGIDPYRSAIILVSAPGAVGKSTLARQIAFETRAVYVDLANAEPVGSNTLVGGLVKSGLYTDWQNGNVGVLIDGLDEARLRVTQEAFEAFLRDVDQLSRGRSMPTVLFGRTGAIQDAWLVLTDAAVLEIGYYGPEAAADFVEALLRAKNPDGAHAATEREAIELLLLRLRDQTEVDGDRFAGYAPVLQAVAERVIQEGNAGALVAEIKAGVQPVTLHAVVSAILERERGKLRPLPFSNPSLMEALYSADEQLDHLIALIYQLPPPGMDDLSPEDARIYDAALKTWVPEHPFLGGRNVPSSAVFDAVIAVRALKRDESAELALTRELARGAASANPFLAEFYAPQAKGGELTFLPPQHIGIIYSSLRARLSLGDTASLFVEGPEEGPEDEILRAEVEITLGRRGSDRAQYVRFESDQTGPIRLGVQVEDIDITVPHTKVEIGPGSEALLIAPISVQCETLVITANRLIVETAKDRRDAAVFLEATHYEGTITSVPVMHGEVSLSASWPGARAHPWTSFATNSSPVSDPRIEEALRRLRKFVIAFRSHSKGSLARYRDKLDHARMTKGSGRAVLDLLLSEHVLSIAGSMYVLDPDRLAEQVGTNYTDCMARRFSEKTIDFVRRALQ